MGDEMEVCGPSRGLTDDDSSCWMECPLGGYCAVPLYHLTVSYIHRDTSKAAFKRQIKLPGCKRFATTSLFIGNCKTS
jgi:hypothetical protein